MPITPVPFKTLLGQEELRTRGHKLGQRHRTLLFLIDGRRPLAEVLSLAHQAGAATQHFEDLLRMGLVELPPDPTPPAPPQTPVLTDEAALTSVDIVVVEPAAPVEDAAADVAAPAAPPAPPVVEVRRVLVPDLPVLHEPPEAPFERTVRQHERFVPEVTPESPFERTQRLPGPAARDQAPPAPKTAPAPRSMPFKTRGKKSGRQVPVLLEPVDRLAPSPPPPEPPPPPAPSLDIDLPIAAGDEARLLQRVRELLTDALRLDAPLFSARTFMRVRSAQSTGELIDLVWEIQDHLSHARRSRKEMQSLEQARELLGLGNTLVAGDDSRPDYLDE